MGKKELFLKKKSDFIRKDLVRVAVSNGAGHIASSLSCVDILVALYYDVLSLNSEDEDRLIFSKAHGCYGLYAILKDLGRIPQEEWENFYIENKSQLKGCSERNLEYGIEAGCGSLGHGLPIAVGLAFANKIKNKKNHIFCVVGDGEMQEGTNWEALQFAVKHNLNNLIIIIDANGLQAVDFIINILDRKKDDLDNRLKGFGLRPISCYGHDVVKLSVLLKKSKEDLRDKDPKIIIARTIKGFGLKCMENVPKFHFRVPDKKELGENYER